MPLLPMKGIGSQQEQINIRFLVAVARAFEPKRITSFTGNRFFEDSRRFFDRRFFVFLSISILQKLSIKSPPPSNFKYSVMGYGAHERASFFRASVRWTSFQRVPTKSFPPVGSVPGSSSHQNQG